MGVYGGEDGLIESFSSRFEADGDSFLFRSNLKSAPIRVTAAERSEEIDRYRRSMRRAMVASVIVTIVSILLLAWIDITYDDSDLSWMTWLLLVPLIGGFAFVTVHISKAPDRRFANRIPAAPKFGLDEVRRRTFEHISWTALLIAPLGALALLIPQRGEKIWSIGYDIKLGIVGVLLTFVVVQAIRKWRFERHQR